MANESYQSNTNIYKYTAKLTFVLDNDAYDIDTVLIKSIAIDSDYKNANMPMIFLTVNINEYLIDLMVKNQDSGIMILNLQRAVANSDMPDLYKDYINDKFIYFISEDFTKLEDINKRDDLDHADADADTDLNDDNVVEGVSIGLLSLDHVNKNKKDINGVISGNLSSIMYYLTSQFPVLIEPPANNIAINNMMMPPMNSVAKALKYLNSLNVFYSTPYRFFIDFDCAYLISTSGKPIKKKGEDISTVLLSCKNIYDEDSQGMIVDEKQALYAIECGLDCELIDNHTTEKSYSNISATDTSGNKSTGLLQNRTDKSVINEKTRNVRISNNNTGLLDNMVYETDTKAIQLLVQKTDIDSSVLTMNKEYIVEVDDIYRTKKYNGRYVLTRKRELYIRNHEDFVMNTMLLLEKVPSDDIEETTKAIAKN